MSKKQAQQQPQKAASQPTPAKGVFDPKPFTKGGATE